MSDVPRSGCAITSRHRHEREQTATQVEQRARLGLRIVVEQRAIARISTIFMNSLGWKLKLPMPIQRDAPRMSRAEHEDEPERDEPAEVGDVAEALEAPVVDGRDQDGEQRADHDPVDLRDVDVRQRDALRSSAYTLVAL